MTKKNTLKLTVLLAVGLLLVFLAQAQESTNASGGDATGSAGTVAYSVGQVFYNTNRTTTTGNEAQGVQHAFEIYALSTKDPALNVSLIAYPNPTTGNLTLQISNYNNEKLSFQLFDILGRKLSNSQIRAQQTQINMNSLPTATYFINVVNQQNKQVHSFKVIKN